MKNLIILLFFVPLFAHAQTTHKVAPKETLYSLGRLYNIHPKELAAYNNISIETGLNIGQIIKIPATANIAPLKSTAVPTIKNEAVVKKEVIIEPGDLPVYHKVEKKETLYHISKLYSNVSVEDIRKWNHLTGDGVSEGTNLIVGYGKGKTVAPVATTVNPINNKSEAPAVTPQPETKAAPKQIPVVEKTTASTKPPVIESASPSVKTEQGTPVVNRITGKTFNGGYFKSLYNDQAQKKAVVEESGTTAIFKSTSGWEDGKYYCLHNTAPAGSIVKITNTNTQKSIYAKVLDVIPDLKQNAGIMVRLCNAAADELGAGENNFESVINY